MSPRPLSAAGSAARRCGSTTCSARPRRSSRGVRCAITLSREGVYRVVGGRTTHRAAGRDRRRRRRVASTALIHTGIVRDDPAQRAARAVHLPGRGTVRDRHPEDSTVQVAEHGHARQHLHARAGRVGRHLRAGVRDRRARRASSDMDPIELRIRNEPEHDPTSGTAILLAAPRRGLSRGGRALRLGATRDAEARRTPRGRMADRHGLCHRHLSVLPLARRRGADHARPATGHVNGRDRRRTRWAWAPPTPRPRSPPNGWALPLESVTVAYGDSSFPGVVLAGGSQQTASIGGAVIAAQRALVERAARSSPATSRRWPDSSRRRGRQPRRRSLQARRARAGARATPRSCTRAARRGDRRGRRASDPVEDVQAWSMHSYGAHLLRGARQRGHRRDPRAAGSSARSTADASSTPRPAASQFRGGIIMGLGLALMEETQFDERNGRIMNPSLAEYHVPVHLDVPRDRRDLDRHPRSARADGRPRHRRDRHHRRRRRGRERDLQRHRRRVRELPITLDKLL